MYFSKKDFLWGSLCFLFSVVFFCIAIPVSAFDADLETSIEKIDNTIPTNETINEENEETEEKSSNIKIIDLDSRDYSLLVSSVFSKYKKEEQEGAVEFLKHLDQYRFKIYQIIKRNEDLVKALEGFLSEVSEEEKQKYTEKIIKIKIDTEEQHKGIYPFVTDGAFLYDSLRLKYGLYKGLFSFIEKNVHSQRKEELDYIKTESLNTRSEISLVFTQLNKKVILNINEKEESSR